MPTDRKRIRNRLEKLVKQVVKNRDQNTCQWCGKHVEGSSCHCSHVIPRSADGRLVYDPENLKVLCFHCHMHVWHKNPLEAAEWFKKKFPDRWKILNHKRLMNRAKGPIKMWEYEEMETRLKGMLS